MNSMNTTTELGSISLCAGMYSPATHATAGWITSLSSLICRNVHEYAAMMKIIRHMRMIQKGTRMRFFQSTGCCEAILSKFWGIARIGGKDVRAGCVPKW
jgi:hypothetical protein